jgi:protein Mpv17
MLPYLANRYFPKVSKMKNVLGCLLFDELLFGPLLFSGYYMVRELAENPGWKGLSRGYEELKDKFVDTIIADWMVWPFANFVNFMWIPIKYQALYVMFVTFFFDILFANIAHRSI